MGRFLNSIAPYESSKIPEHCGDYQTYIARILDGIKEDLLQAYPELNIDISRAVWDIFLDIFQRTKDRFIFVMDEWDAVFHMPFTSEEIQREYLLFLKNLLKDQVYVEFAYMTGVLPIVKYSGGSELNMFFEYDMATKRKFSEYFGFLDKEVDELYQIYQKGAESDRITREELRLWYDGYFTAAGSRIYNPRSIVCALSDGELANYWTSSGPYDEIYSAVVVYGLLTYEGGKVWIPNREIMEQFRVLLMTKDSLGYVYQLAKESEQMLKATLSGDIQTMTRILKYVHDTEPPILSYNNEVELSAVVNLVYQAARDRYQMEREDKAGEGYVDFIFYPERKDEDALILELKVDGTPEEAIQQIKDRNYMLRFKGKLGERSKYTGRILVVGISYNKKTKEHFCKVEIM